MKISIGDVKLVRGWEYCEEATDLKVCGRKELQISQLLRAKEVKVFDRGNTKTTVSFKVKRQHATAKCALAFILSHGEEISEVQGEALFELEDSLTSIFGLKDASVAQVESRVDGVTTFHRYEIVGSRINKTKTNKTEGN